MFRLIRWLFSLVFVVVVVYVAVSVPLGDKTLWQHLKSIAGSKESKDLVDGVRRRATEALGRRDGGTDGTDDRLTPAERDQLRKLIKKKLTEAERAPDGQAPKR